VLRAAALTWLIILTTPWWPALDGDVALMTVAIAFLASVTVLIVFYTSFNRRLASFSDISWEELTPLETALREQEESIGFFWARGSDAWSFQPIMKRLADRGVPRPRTIIDVTVADRLGRIERPQHFMEPEPIMPSSNLGYAMTTFVFTMYSFGIVAQLCVGNLLFAGLMFLLAIPLLVSIPVVRDQFRRLWETGGIVLAGQGWIRYRRSHMWTTKDSMLIVCRIVGTSSIAVILSGPNRVTVLSFINERDPDFIKLWQRWNHPDPRPELVYEDDAAL